MKYDFNQLEKKAAKLISDNRPGDAIKLYLYMADGDPSLDAGYLGEKLGQCYELLGDLHAARYWYNRAVAENPGVRLYAEGAIKRLGNLDIEYLLND